MIANFITASRILFSFILFFCPAFSIQFYGFYIAAGITDMIDGTVARKTGKESAFGEKLDSIADLTFIFAASLKILPQLNLPVTIWIWTGIIAAAKICVIGITSIKQKKFTIAHSIANKITGFLLFILPLTVFSIDLKISSCVVCISATAAVLLELIKK